MSLKERINSILELTNDWCGFLEEVEDHALPMVRLIEELVEREKSLVRSLEALLLQSGIIYSGKLKNEAVINAQATLSKLGYGGENG